MNSGSINVKNQQIEAYAKHLFLLAELAVIT